VIKEGVEERCVKDISGKEKFGYWCKPMENLSSYLTLNGWVDYW